MLLALLGGMALSSWQRGTVRLRVWVLAELGPRLLGGFLMGLGATVILGGNDTLLLLLILALSPARMVADVAIALIVSGAEAGAS